jgi:hypothetical protein
VTVKSSFAENLFPSYKCYVRRAWCIARNDERLLKTVSVKEIAGFVDFCAMERPLIVLW